jgi:hypothetical protein
MSDRLFPFCLAYFFAIAITESSIVNVSLVVIARVLINVNIRVNFIKVKFILVAITLPSGVHYPGQ